MKPIFNNFVNEIKEFKGTLEEHIEFTYRNRTKQELVIMKWFEEVFKNKNKNTPEKSIIPKERI